MSRQFYTVEQLGPTQTVTPDGFLLCEEVPIARTGVQIYGPNETNIDPGDDGLVYIMRTEEEVFRPETIASFNGKPFINEHPTEGAVTPETWRRLICGVVLNPRRGTGEHESHLLADILVFDPQVMELIRGGKREVSCGYSAEWFETGIGHGEQRDIIGNHVALVERARCGSECSIGDGNNNVQDCNCNEGGSSMKWEDLKKKLMAALRAKDDVTFDAALSEAKKSGKAITIRITKDDELEVGESSEPEQHQRTKFTDDALEGIFERYDGLHSAHDRQHRVHDDRLNAHDNRFEKAESDIKELQGTADDGEGGLQNAKAVEGELKFEAPPGTGDQALREAQDSSLLADAFNSSVALGEVLVPGITVPKFDRSKKLVATFTDMCNFRRRALILASKDQHTAMLMIEARSGRTINDGDIQAMTCGQVRDFFNAVGAMKKRMNNNTNTNREAAVVSGPGSRNRNAGTPRTLAEINKANREKWGGKS